MSRPTKQGLDYFPVEVHFMDDIKVRKVLKACGAQSIAVLISLLGNIYADRGYYLVWDSDMPFLIADKVGISEGAVLEIVGKAVQVGLFDRELFKKNILTSRGIQRRFFEAVARRKEVFYEKEILLLEVNDNNNLINVDINPVNVCNNSVNVYSNEQSKVKKSKVKESKEKKSKYICASDTVTGSEEPYDYVFERAWAAYPKKRGKNQISEKCKREIAKVGLSAMLLAVERYKQETAGVEEEYLLNGSTFFHGRYKDYLGDDFVPVVRRSKERGRYDALKEWNNNDKG